MRDARDPDHIGNIRYVLARQQEGYVTCLDLGEAGALFTTGWDRNVAMVEDVARKTKREINMVYPSRAERAAALASADPERVTNVTASSRRFTHENEPRFP